MVQGRDRHRRARRPHRACRSSTTTRRRSAPTASPTRWPPSSATAARRSWSTSGRPPPSRSSRRRASTSAGPSSPGHRDLPRRALRPGPPLLPRVELVEPRSVLGKNTVESIQSGHRSTASPPRSTACAGGFEEELGAVHGGGHRRPGRPHRPRTPRRIEHHEPVADPATGCASSSRRNAATCRRAATGDDRRPVPLRARRHRRRPGGPASPTLAAGGETGVEVVRRRPAHAAPGAGQAGLRHAARLDRRDPAVRGAGWTDGLRRASAACRSATGSARRARSSRTRTGELSVKVASLGAARRGPAQLRRQVAGHHRRRPPVPAALRRPVGQRGVPGDAARCAAG